MFKEISPFTLILDSFRVPSNHERLLSNRVSDEFVLRHVVDFLEEMHDDLLPHHSDISVMDFAGTEPWQIKYSHPAQMRQIQVKIFDMAMRGLLGGLFGYRDFQVKITHQGLDMIGVDAAKLADGMIYEIPS